MSSGESGEPLWGSLRRRVHQPAIHDARFQVAPDQLEHLLVMHPSCDPGHQNVVLNAIEERVEIKIDAPHRAIGDELACPLDSLMLRAPRPKAEAMGMELRVEDGREHLRDGLADHPIHRSRHSQLPLTARGLGDHHPPNRLRPVSARVEPRADLRPMVLQPRPQLLGAHPVDAWGTGVLLDASERLGEIPAGQELLPQSPPRRGEGRCHPAPDRCCALAGRSSGFTLGPPRPGPSTGLAAVNATITSTNVLTLGFAFGPSQRPTIPPVLWPLLTSPRRAPPSRTHRPAPPREPDIGRGIWDTRGDLPR